MTQEGIISAFPLPDLAFFPKTYLSLRTFEPQYLQMVKDIFKSTQLN